MGEKKKNKMPSGQGGLIQYFESGETGIKLKPHHVVGFGVVVSALVLLTKFL